MTNVIHVENISKRYHLGASQTGSYRTLRESIMSAVKGPWKRLRLSAGKVENVSTKKALWALKDVSFEVKAGETVGLIGRNGAGKSTLLKIISRITEPTEGRITMRGRVASLLEVGTGFHHELTGRENIYLNGCILGMTRRELDRRFDEIVAFSEIEDFLDTPVKRYSSGMIVRLAFAVAAHLDPEILIVDEVLAVGDAEFQKKCLGKMSEVANSGRTILFVSHNIAAVQKLCTRAVFLRKGQVEQFGDCDQVVNTYLQSAISSSDQFEKLADHRPPHMAPIFEKAELINQQGQRTTHFLAGSEMNVELTYTAPAEFSNPGFGIVVAAFGGDNLFFLQTLSQHGAIANLPSHGTIRCRVPFLPLVPGRYMMSFSCFANRKLLDNLQRALTFTVEESDCFGTGMLPPSNCGKCLVNADWHFEAT